MTERHEHRVLDVGVFDTRGKANQLVERLIRDDFPMDQISLLGKGGGSGDDILGVTYHSTGERMKVWGEHGAFWGGLWGLLVGAAGLFVIPGLGPLLAAGPIVEALAGALAGAAVTGGAMAGAAAVAQLASALHRIGIPEDKLEEIQSAIEAGKYVVILHLEPASSERYDQTLRWAGADPVYQFPVIY